MYNASNLHRQQLVALQVVHRVLVGSPLPPVRLHLLLRDDVRLLRPEPAWPLGLAAVVSPTRPPLVLLAQRRRQSIAIERRDLAGRTDIADPSLDRRRGALGLVVGFALALVEGAALAAREQPSRRLLLRRVDARLPGAVGELGERVAARVAPAAVLPVRAPDYVVSELIAASRTRSVVAWEDVLVVLGLVLGPLLALDDLACPRVLCAGQRSSKSEDEPM